MVGASNVRIALWEDYALEASDVVVSGDVPGASRVFGAGRHWYYQFQVPEGVVGAFTVRLSSRSFAAKPVRVAYDTVRSVAIQFGTPRWDGRRVVIPVSADVPLIGLEKSCFRLTGMAGRCYLYGRDREYQLHVIPTQRSGVFRISMARQVCKSERHSCGCGWRSAVEVRYGSTSDSNDR